MQHISNSYRKERAMLLLSLISRKLVRCEIDLAIPFLVIF